MRATVFLGTGILFSAVFFAQGAIRNAMNHSDPLTIFLAGDVMTGRGIDQVLPTPSHPLLHEPYVRDAKEYVALAQRSGGPFPYPVDSSYIWGDALQEWTRRAPDLKIINLETAITSSDDFWKDKGIHYRMHPDNISVLAAAKIDFCSLANNHLLDWGYPGLAQTLESLRKSGVKYAGAGTNAAEAAAPALFEINGNKIFIFSFGLESSGIPAEWAATETRAGINLLKDLSNETVQSTRKLILAAAKPQDFVVVSIHWGANWGYQITSAQIEFSRKLIDEAGVDLIHGHSSHHVKGIEVYKGKLVLYGCGDFLNDYEGIEGYEEFRGDLSLMYFASIDPATGQLHRLHMVPVTMRRFRITRASNEDAEWLQSTLQREGRYFDTSVKPEADDSGCALTLSWK